MAATADEESSLEKLTDIFESGFKLFYELDSSSASPNSVGYKKEVQKGIDLMEKATHIVNQVRMFSTNEQIEEVATADLKYLLLPAILGSLTLKVVGDNRLETIEAAEIYFKDYLERLKSYGVHTNELRRDVKGAAECGSSEKKAGDRQRNSIPLELETMVLRRNSKISRYKQKKEYEQKRQALKKKMEDGSVDDEIAREYYMLLFNIWITTALEELESIEMERPILLHMANLKLEGKPPKTPPVPKKQPLKPIIIAKNEIQKQVFGVGYPSIPAMTVDEFYKHRYGEHSKEQALSGLSLQKMAENAEQDALEREKEDQEKEEREEKEDTVALERAREFDDWKDDHRRGWGNRKNMG